MKKRYIALYIVLLLVFLMILFRSILFQSFDVPEFDRSDLESAGLDVPEFRVVESDFVHSYSQENYPFRASALIDIDLDGNSELFLGAGSDQNDLIVSYDPVANEFNSVELSGGVSYGAISIDYDLDLDVDILVAKEDGVYLYTNPGWAVSKLIDIDSMSDGLFVPISLAIADLDSNGLIDIYVNTFIHPSKFKSGSFNDPDVKSKNYMFLNKGTAKAPNFVDVTDQMELSLNQNTFDSYFADLDDDLDLDLVVSTNTDGIYLFQNNLNIDDSFEKIKISENGYWMGSSIGDFDNDGDFDLFFSNIGNSLPGFIARGDLTNDQILETDWLYFENQGNFNFNQADMRLNDLEFGWGSDIGDFNLDGSLDLVVSENYVKLFSHKLTKAPGRFLLNADDGKFIPSTIASGASNYYFGNTVYSNDFNGDGSLDLIYVNMNGPVRWLENKYSDYFVKVILPDNLEYMGAEVILETKDTTLKRKAVSGTGFGSDKSNEFIFPLSDNPKYLEVRKMNGDVERFSDIEVNGIIRLD